LEWLEVRGLTGHNRPIQFHYQRFTRSDAVAIAERVRLLPGFVETHVRHLSEVSRRANLRRIAAAGLLVAAASLLFSCHRQQEANSRRRIAEETNASNQTPDYWRLDNECAEAAARFWKLAGYHEGQSGSEYTNHFNRQRGKCFIRLKDTSSAGSELTVEDRIYDAVEHVEVMEHVEWPQNGKSVLRINDKLVADTPAALAPMDALMQQ